MIWGVPPGCWIKVFTGPLLEGHPNKPRFTFSLLNRAFEEEGNHQVPPARSSLSITGPPKVSDRRTGPGLDMDNFHLVECQGIPIPGTRVNDLSRANTKQEISKCIKSQLLCTYTG